MTCEHTQRKSFTQSYCLEPQHAACRARTPRLRDGSCDVREAACAARVVGGDSALLQVVQRGNSHALLGAVQHQLCVACTSMMCARFFGTHRLKAARCLPSSSRLQSPRKTSRSLSSRPCCASRRAAASDDNLRQKCGNAIVCNAAALLRPRVQNNGTQRDG